MRPTISPLATSLIIDYVRFRKLHSWYKHIPLHGRDFYVYEKPEGDWHWYFDWEKPDHDDCFKMRVGPFLRGTYIFLDSPMTTNLDIIMRKAGDSFAPWLAEHYPHLTKLDWSDTWPRREDDNGMSQGIIEIYRVECGKYARRLADGFYELTGEVLPWTEDDFNNQYLEPSEFMNLPPYTYTYESTIDL